MTEHQSQYLLIFMGLVAVAVLIEAIALGALAFATAKLMKQLGELTAEAKVKVYPILDKVHHLTEKGIDLAEIAREVAVETRPKIRNVVDNISETSDVYRAKIAEVDSLISDTTAKARRQSDRVDSMVSGAISRTGQVAEHVQHAILSPARQIAGFVSGAKTGIEALIHNFASKPAPRPPAVRRSAYTPSAPSTSTRPAVAPPTPRPIAFEGKSVYTGKEDDYHA